MSLKDDAKLSLELTLQAFAKVLVDTMLAPRQIELLRIVAAESKQFPEAASNFDESGPRLVRQQLARYFDSQHKRGNLKRSMRVSLRNIF